MRLSERHAIFIGCKLDSSLRRCFESLSSSEKKYVSRDDSTFLRICRLGEDDYVGKVIDEPISTDRVDDVRRNVLSILQRLAPEIRLPANLSILVCEVPEPGGQP